MRLGFNFDYKRLFILIEYSACKDQIERLILRFIRNEEHWYIQCIAYPCSKKLEEIDVSELKEDMTIECFCKLAYKLIKINGVYLDKNSKMIMLYNTGEVLFTH
jgi:hypothetical protein